MTASNPSRPARTPRHRPRRLLAAPLLTALALWPVSLSAVTRNLVPNPRFTGSLGASVGATGTIPDLWRGFAVGGGAAEVSLVPIAAGELYPGSPPTRAVRLEVGAFGADQGFDDDNARFAILSETPYHAELWIKSANGGGAPQGVQVGFPLFTGVTFLGRQPGGFNTTATAGWSHVSGPTFSDPEADNAFLSIRLVPDGGDDAILVVFPEVTGPLPLFSAGRDFGASDRWVATTVFHWYTAAAGQLSGPWRPLEGRPNWTGEPDFWLRQVADMMDAGIDVLYVHLVPGFEQQRLNLFRAIEELRARGWDPPKAVPFLDPLITWFDAPIDLATNAGKDAFVGQYVRWFEQFLAVNSDELATSYLGHLDGKIVLDTWHCNPGFTDNVGALSRADVEGRLAAALGSSHEGFDSGVYMIGSTNGLPPPFTDEIIHQFSNLAYFATNTANGKRAATVNGGVWDQNVRTPGTFVPRDGGVHFIQAWSDLNATRNDNPPIRHTYIESWNEYDEGSGIYEGDPGPPYIAPGNVSGNTDVWSTMGNPREYIDTARAGARTFNDTPDLDSRFLLARAPSVVAAGDPMTIEIVVRNEGDLEWSAADGFSLGQADGDTHVFGTGRHAIDDVENEVARYGGVFRGRAVRFELAVTAPITPGMYETHWQLVRDDGGESWFGPPVTIRFYTCGANPSTCPIFFDDFESGDTSAW
ncbi:MAG: hypothetical protein ABI689_17455 [Thermoanaerobaculia bacterium]